MRILVVCGAGASSTFVAQRVRHAAHDQGLPYSAFAGTELSLPIDLDAADVVLVGPHLAHALERIQRDAARRGTAVVLLPPDIFTDLDGTAPSRSSAPRSRVRGAPAAAAQTLDRTTLDRKRTDHAPHDPDRPDRILPRPARAAREAVRAGGEGLRHPGHDREGCRAARSTRRASSASSPSASSRATT